MTRIRRRPANLKLAGLRVAVVAVLRVNETIRRVWPRPAAGGTEHGRRRAGTVLSERLPDYHDSTRQRSGGTVARVPTDPQMFEPGRIYAVTAAGRKRSAARATSGELSLAEAPQLPLA